MQRPGYFRSNLRRERLPFGKSILSAESAAILNQEADDLEKVVADPLIALD